MGLWRRARGRGREEAYEGGMEEGGKWREVERNIMIREST